MNGHDYKVEGQSRADDKQVYEFYGCAFHGCSRCFPDRKRQQPLSDKTVGEAHDMTLERHNEIESAGYTIHTMWECDLKRELKENPRNETVLRQCGRS